VVNNPVSDSERLRASSWQNWENERLRAQKQQPPLKQQQPQGGESQGAAAYNVDVGVNVTVTVTETEMHTNPMLKNSAVPASAGKLKYVRRQVAEC
jgi:hypothetical protein